MTNFLGNSPENPRTLLPTLRDCFDRPSSSSPNKNRPLLTPIRAGLDNSVSDAEDEDKNAQNNLFSVFKGTPNSPNLDPQDNSPPSKETPNNGLPPANPLATGKYSLDADMLFGWKPKFGAKAPIPLRFSSSILEDVITVLEDETKLDKYPEIVYQGFRPDNTLIMHQKLATNETYLSRLNSAFQTKIVSYWGSVNAKRPFTGMKEGVGEDCLVFDSIYENGNLDTVIMKGPNDYDLFLRVDSNTRGHTNWYNFTVKNMKKGQTVKFTIMNLAKPDSLYQRGMKPYIYSQRLHDEKGIKWEQKGENITFRLANISYLGQNFEEYSRKKHYKVSFEYTFPYDDDSVSFALCVPYSYTQLLQYLQYLTDTYKPAEQGGFISHGKLCNSLGGVEVPLITITDPDESEFPISKRQYIVCSGRVHPGESNSSWMMQGFISDLLKNDEETRYLTKRFIFKIIPMLNPDGVILGNHRTGFCGNDLNRQYISPKDVLHPSVWSLRDLIKELTHEKKDNIFAYFDFHGHSLMKSVFMYGSEFPIHSYNYYKVKVLPKLLSKKTEMFRSQACAYTIPKSKLATARAVFSMHFGVVHCYTVEASYASFLNTEKESVPFTEESFMKMGIMLVEGIRDYKKILEEEEAVAAAYRARLDALYETIDIEGPGEDGENGEYDGDKKKNRFRVRKRKNAKGTGNKKGDDSRVVVAPKERRSKTEPVVFSDMHTMNNLGIFKILEEIKDDAKKENENLDSCDNRSVDDSDHGDADDDLDEAEMKLLQENIITNMTELKADAKVTKIKPKKLKKQGEERSKSTKEKRFLNQIIEKEIPDPPSVDRSPVQNSRNNSPPKSALMTTKYFQRTHNWITRIKQKIPLVPREVQMIVEKPSETIEIQDYLGGANNNTRNGNGVFLATKNGFRRHLVNSIMQKKKLEFNVDQPRKNESITQHLKSSITDMTSTSKIGLDIKACNLEHTIQIPRPPSGYLMKSNTCILPPNDTKMGETFTVETDSRTLQISRQNSLKALLRESKCPLKSRFEAFSMDQKDVRDSCDNFTSNQIFYEKEQYERDRDYERSADNSPEFSRTAYGNGNAIPRITIIQAQMKADNVPGVALSLKKDKKLPISYVAYKNNIRLKKKIRDKKGEGH